MPRHLIVFIFLIITFTGCAKIHDPRFRKDHSNSIEYHQPINNATEGSYFLTSMSHMQTDNKIIVQRGMAIAVANTERGCILLTSKHLIQDARCTVATQWHQNKQTLVKNKEEVEVEILFEDTAQDLALVLLPQQDRCPIVPITSKKAELGSEITTLGQPLPNIGAMTRGIVSGYWPTSEGLLMVSDMTSMKGFSGGGVFNKKRQLIGLVMGKTADARQGFSYIIPACNFKSIIDGVFSSPE